MDRIEGISAKLRSLLQSVKIPHQSDVHLALSMKSGSQGGRAAHGEFRRHDIEGSFGRCSRKTN